MARDGSGNYTLPANTQAVSGDPISSTKFNTLVQDLEADANTDRPIVAGGTGASTALAARANLGLEIGVNVQAYDAGLLSIAGLTTLADRSIYTTASDTYAVYTLTAAGRAILDDADAAAQRTTLGLGTAALKNTGTSGDAVPLLNAANTFGDTVTATRFQVGSFVMDDNIGLGADIPGFTFDTNDWLVFSRATNTFEFGISSVNALSITGSGATILGNTIWHAGNDGAASGLDADLIDGVQPSAFALTILDDADASAARTTLGLANGATTTISAFALTMLDDVDAAAVRTTIGVGLGTGDLVAANNLSDVANASTARTNLGLAIGTNVQAYDQQLQDIAALAVTDGGFIVGNGSTFVLETDATARTSLGLGTAATVNTGTSGATIPLLNGSNTFSAAQFVNTTGTAASFSLQRTDDGATGAFFDLNHISASPAANDVPATLRVLGRDSGNNTTVYGRLRWIVSDPTDTSEDSYWTISSLVAGSETSELDSLSGTLRFNANTVWHAGNDGAGSGLDADTLDGVQGSAYAALAGATFTGDITISKAVPLLDLVATSSNIPVVSLRNASRYDDIRNTTAGLEFRVDTSGTPKSMLFNTAGGLQVRTAASTETTSTLTVASANTTIQATGDITIPNAVFSAGDIILIYAGASSRTITEGASVTMRLGGTATTGSRTLAARGVAVLFFVSSSEVVVSGGAVT